MIGLADSHQKFAVATQLPVIDGIPTGFSSEFAAPPEINRQPLFIVAKLLTIQSRTQVTAAFFFRPDFSIR